MQKSPYLSIIPVLLLAALCSIHCPSYNIVEPRAYTEDDIVDVSFCAEDDTTGPQNQTCKNWPTYGVKTCLKTDRHDYVVGDTVRMEYRVINVSSASLYFEMTGFPGVSFEIEEIDWFYPRIVSPLSWDTTLAQQESYAESTLWDMRDTSGTLATAGSYHLHGSLSSSDNPNFDFPMELELVIGSPALARPAFISDASSLSICWEDRSKNVLRITYSVVTAGHVELSILENAGNVLATLVDENRQAGSWTVQWNSTNHDDGVYAVSLESPGSDETIWFEKD